MDTTENKTEQYTKTFKIETRRDILPSQVTAGLAKLGYYAEVTLVESPPMEVKDAEAAFIAYQIKQGISENAAKIQVKEKLPSYELFLAGSQLQPPVISAPDFLKEKGIIESGKTYAKTLRCDTMVELLTEYLQRQGQKTNQNKL